MIPVAAHTSIWSVSAVPRRRSPRYGTVSSVSAVAVPWIVRVWKTCESAVPLIASSSPTSPKRMPAWAAASPSAAIDCAAVGSPIPASTARRKWLR